MNYRNIYIISHAYRGTSFRGPTDVIIDNLIELKVPFLLVEHDLCGVEDTFVFEFTDKGKKNKAGTISRLSSNKFIRYFQEYKLNQSLARKLFNKKGVLVCVNPLNALAGIAIKKRGLCNKVVFISADYTKKRFGNFLLDRMYCWLDKYVSLSIDITGSVSTRIQSLRRKFGLPEERNLFFPNTPPTSLLKNVENKQKQLNSLVSIGSLSNQLSYYTMFEAVGMLKKEYPNITLKLIGGGEKEIEYRKYVSKNGLDKNILFLGWMKHSDTLREVAQAQIGLAFYSGMWSVNYYGDSMKIREYVGLGLPVITTNTHSTVDDIRKYRCGFVIDDKPEVLAKKIRFLLNPDHYEEYSKNALKMSDKYAGVYKEFLSDILIRKSK